MIAAIGVNRAMPARVGRIMSRAARIRSIICRGEGWLLLTRETVRGVSVAVQGFLRVFCVGRLGRLGRGWVR